MTLSALRQPNVMTHDRACDLSQRRLVHRWLALQVIVLPPH
jgi:hypothetical protein